MSCLSSTAVSARTALMCLNRGPAFQVCVPVPDCSTANAGVLCDLNGDGNIGVGDLLILLDAWGQTGSPADLNGDGVVNVLDLIILLLNFGS